MFTSILSLLSNRLSIFIFNNSSLSSLLKIPSIPNNDKKTEISRQNNHDQIFHKPLCVKLWILWRYAFPLVENALVPLLSLFCQTPRLQIIYYPQYIHHSLLLCALIHPQSSPLLLALLYVLFVIDLKQNQRVVDQTLRTQKWHILFDCFLDRLRVLNADVHLALNHVKIHVFQCLVCLNALRLQQLLFAHYLALVTAAFHVVRL